jgi:hypothetical protein
MAAIPPVLVCAVMAVLEIAVLLASYVSEYSVTKSKRQLQCTQRRSLERQSLLRQEYSNELKSCILLYSCYSSLIDSL